MNQGWHVIHLATPLNEKPLLNNLREHKIEYEWWFPKYKTKRQLKKKTKVVFKPVFSTYAFLNCKYTPKVLRVVEEVTGCYFVPSASDTVHPVPSDQMEEVRLAVDEYTNSNPLPPSLWNNREVEIISGAFAGYSAKVKAVVKDTIIAEIDMFGRVVPITLRKAEVSAI